MNALAPSSGLPFPVIEQHFLDHRANNIVSVSPKEDIGLVFLCALGFAHVVTGGNRRIPHPMSLAGLRDDA
jgi:hypothetical protein